MKPILFSLCTVAGLCLAMSSCTTSYYATNANPAPMIREQNEVVASVGRSIYNYSRSTDVHVAYSPIEHLAVMGNFNWLNPSQQRTTLQDFGMDAVFAEGALGYYDSWNESFGFDIYAGLGVVENGVSYLYNYSSGVPNNTVDFNYSRIFVQPAIAYTSQFFDAQFALRGSQVIYGMVDTDTLSNDTFIDLPPSEGDQFFLLEPGITLRGGYRHIKAQVQLSTSFNLQGVYLPRDYFSISFGLVFNFKPSFRDMPKPDFEF